MIVKKITLNELRTLVKQVLNEEKSPYDYFKEHIIELIDLNDYDSINKNAQGDDKLRELFKIYKSEKNYELKQGVPIKKSLENWLRGLPAAIDLPIYYNEIAAFLYSIGYIEVREIDDDEIDKIFYNGVVDVILDSIKIR